MDWDYLRYIRALAIAGTFAKAGEILGMQILAQHNVATINMLMREVRQAIKDGKLDDLQKEWGVS